MTELNIVSIHDLDIQGQSKKLFVPTRDIPELLNRLETCTGKSIEELKQLEEG